jgi:RHS repeat-associated protein
LSDLGDSLQVIQGDGTLAVFPRSQKQVNLCTSANPLDGKILILGKGKSRHYSWIWANGRVLRFDHLGRLVSIESPSGAAVLLWYGTGHDLMRVRDPQGRELTFEYGALRKPGFHGVIAINSPVGRFAYEHPEPEKGSGHPLRNAGDLVHVRYPVEKPSLPTGRIYHFEDARHPTLLTGISLLEGAKTIRLSTYGYDETGRATMSTHAGGVNKIIIDRSHPDKVIVLNSRGQPTTFRHGLIAGEHRLLEVRGSGCAGCGETNIRYGYDKLARPEEITRLSSSGAPIAGVLIERDELGRPVRRSRVTYGKTKKPTTQLLERVEYDGESIRPRLVATPSVISGRENTLALNYDDRGQVSLVTESGFSPSSNGATPIDRSTSYRYSIGPGGRRLLTEIDGPLPNGPLHSPTDSDITQYEWDNEGRAVSAVTLPGTAKATMHYDGALRLVAAIGQEGKIEWAYDFQGNLTRMRRNGIEYRANYGADGRVLETGVAGAGGLRNQRLFGYDNALRPAWTVSHLGIAHLWEMDTEDRLLRAEMLSSRIKQGERFEYNDDGRPVAATDQHGGVRRFQWNDHGMLDAETDRRGRLNLYRYNESGLVAITRAAGDPLAELRIEIGRDDYGRAQSVKTGRAVFRQVVDDFGRPIELVSADSGRTTRKFDVADRLIGEADGARNRATFEYDVAGRVIRQSVYAIGSSKSSVTAFRYAGARLAAIDHADQSERFEHDAQGRQVARIVVLRLANGHYKTYTTRHRFDERGRLAQTTLPDASLLNYRYNTQDQLVAVEHQRLASSWLSTNTPLAREIERDLIGIRRFVYGNGIEAKFERSAEGGLARAIYQKIGGKGRTLNDTRYLWDAEGNLFEQMNESERQTHAYDGQNRLIATALSKPGTGFGTVHRFLYDPTGNRVLSQDNVLPQEAYASTRESVHSANSSHLTSSGGLVVETNANGHIVKDGDREYKWDALGRLVSIQQAEKVIASYRYNHRGERIEKRTEGGRIHFLYSEKGKVSAEVDSEGRIRRQYIYLGDMPLVVIDSEAGVDAHDPVTAWGRLATSLTRKWTTWANGDIKYTYLHNSHLGAPEFATDASGEVRWSGSYSSFGKVQVDAKGSTWTLNLRLPGQYFDAESNLHYNVHRYYDPSRGRYLSPDPLGLRGGINTYAYADSNPLKNIDPMGLILFAFDGTGNGENPSPQSSLSNVQKFLQSYDQAKNGKAFYITGIGTTNKDMQYEGNMATGDGFAQRIDLGFKFLNGFIDEDNGSGDIDIDVIGFSRGAAEARAWLNMLTKEMGDGTTYTVGKKTRCLNLRFAGLWDTVPHLGINHANEKDYKFAIPAVVKFAAHAVALNEHRSGYSDYDLRSIMSGPNQRSTAVRVESGFIGAHSDIGGGYATGDLSNVALVWMLAHARSQGIAIDTDFVQKKKWNVVSNPIIHDASINYGWRGSVGSTRNVVYGDGPAPLKVLQTKVTFDQVSTESTYRDERQLPKEKLLIQYYLSPKSCHTVQGNPDVGLVNMSQYKTWLDVYKIPVLVEPVAFPCRR